MKAKFTYIETVQKRVFDLTQTVSYSDWVSQKRTPSEWGILSYLRLRQLEEKPPATREDILLDSGLSERTVDAALRTLRKQGAVEKKEIFVPVEWNHR